MDFFSLKRFVNAQAPVYPQVLAELRAGQKRTHWIWFIFPQLKGLGSSYNSIYYAIRNRKEARAYLAHQVLGARLWECCEALLSVTGKSAFEILGSPDDRKVQSCMTLFSLIEDAPTVFTTVLQKYYEGKPDTLTLELFNDSQDSKRL